MAYMAKGIDISEYQSKIDWTKVKESGLVDYAILRCGIRGRADKLFEENYRNATAAGVPLGVYYYTAALDVKEAKKDAECVIQLLRGKRLDFPVYYDFEWTGDKKGVIEGQFKLTKQQCTAIIQTFCAAIEAAGYWVGIYASDSWFYSHIDADLQRRYAVWSAKVADGEGNPATMPPKYATTYKMWQYSWVGKIPGIPANVDTDYCYMDYPSAIKAKGLNGYSTIPARLVTVTVNGVPENEAATLTASIKAMGYPNTTIK